jgi:diacylglycerol kinase (ATP)
MAGKVPRALLFYNPRAPGPRSGGRRRLDSLCATFRARQVILDIMATEGPGHVLQTSEGLEERGYDLFIAWGGDGTVNEVGNVAARLDRPLGILPGGTLNMLARELGVPRRLDQATDLLFHGALRRIKAGRAGERLFFVMAGAGFDAAVCRAVSPRHKDALGRLAYLAHGGGLLFTYPFPTLSVRCDGMAFNGTQVVISNVPHYAGRLKLAPLASLDSTALDLCVLKGGGALDYLQFMLRLLIRRHTRWRELVYFKGWSFALASSDPVPVQVDGEYCGTLPVRVELVPEALQVVTPAGDSPSPLAVMLKSAG